MANDSWLSTHLSLLLRVRDPQNEAAWYEFVDKYRSPIVSYCCHRFHVETNVAEEIAQDVLLKLLKEMRGFEYRADKSFRSWLKTVTKNALLSYFRKEQRRKDRATGDSNLQQLIDNLADDANADELTDSLSREMQRELLQQSERLVRQRVDEQTWTAYLQRRAGKRAKEIAPELDMKVAAVHKAKSRVTEMIRQEISMILKQGPSPD